MSEIISPAELMREYLLTNVNPAIVPHVVVGPANDAEQQAGVVQLVDAGLPRTERYLPIVWIRAQMRCLAHDLSSADRIARHLYDVVNGKVRQEITAPSTGERYLVHLMNIVAGPSMHYDSKETWETLLFAELMVGLDPIP